MNQAYQALFYALFVIAFFTLDSMGLTRVDHRGYRPVNNTLPKLNPYDPNVVTTPNPYQGWSGGQSAGNNANQWNRFNNTNHGIYNGYQNSSITNPWIQRPNNTASYPGTYNPGLPGWNPQQQPNANPNWQRQNQSHLYPQLPQVNPSWAGVRPLPIAPTTPSNLNPNRWNNTYGRWNNTFVPPPQYPGGAGYYPNQNNWSQNQNRTWGNAPTVPSVNNPNYPKGPQSYPGSNLPNQTAGSNWWNRPNTTNNNFGWGNNAGQNTWGGGGSNIGQNNWRNSAPNPGDNTWSNGPQNNWRDSNSGMPNNNYPNPGRDNSGIQGNSGAPLAPIGSGTGASGNVPLAPIGGNNVPNSWNAGSNNSPQLAPLAPLSYGVNDPNDPLKKGNTNPYARMFN